MTVNPLIIPDSEMENSQNLLQQAANVPLPPPTQEERNFFSWTEEAKSVIVEHELYHKKMLEMLEQVKLNGPVKKLISPPKRKLMDVFNEQLGTKKKKDDNMSPDGLHLYLQKHIADMTKSISREKFNFTDPKDFTDAIAQLQEAYKHLKRQNAQSMFFNIVFGRYLNELFIWFSRQKQNAVFTQSWDSWLQSNIDISTSYSRKLRQLSTLLYDYKYSWQVDLPINEILSKKVEIRKMLSIEKYATFWKQECVIPVEVNSSQSETEMSP